MKTLPLTVAILAALLSAGQKANAQTSQTATVTATGKDGTTFTGSTRKGACSGHGGVQSFALDPATTAATAPAKKTPAPAHQTAIGGGPGQVWVNTASHVYHCQGDRYYGKTKAGTYMTEAAAKSEGDRPDHGKACS